MKELILGGARIVRMRYAVAAFEKISVPTMPI